MIKLSEIREKGEACRDKLDRYISAEIELNFHASDTWVKFRFYDETKGSIEYDTAEGLIAHMDAILSDETPDVEVD